MSWVSISINIIGTILFIADFVLDLTLALTYLKKEECDYNYENAPSVAKNRIFVDELNPRKISNLFKKRGHLRPKTPENVHIH